MHKHQQIMDGLVYGILTTSGNQQAGVSFHRSASSRSTHANLDSTSTKCRCACVITLKPHLVEFNTFPRRRFRSSKMNRSRMYVTKMSRRADVDVVVLARKKLDACQIDKVGPYHTWPATEYDRYVLNSTVSGFH